MKISRARAAYNVWAWDHKELVDRIVAEKQKLKDAEGEKNRREEGKEEEMGNEEGKEQQKVGDEEGKEQVKDGREDGKDQSEGRDEGEEKKEVQGERKAKFPVSVYQEVAKAEFQKLDKEEQDKWKQQAKEEHESQKSEAEARRRAAYPDTPAGRQGTIERFLAWMLAIADEARKATGLHISVISVHAGRTMGTPGQSFGTAYRDAIDNFEVPIFGEYLNNSFTADDCKAMSLNGAGPDLGALYKKNGQVEVNTVEGGKAGAAVKVLGSSGSGENHSEMKTLNAGDANSTPTPPTSEPLNKRQETKTLGVGDANSTPPTSELPNERQETETLGVGGANSTPPTSEPPNERQGTSHRLTDSRMETKRLGVGDGITTAPTCEPNHATVQSLEALPTTAKTSESNTTTTPSPTPAGAPSHSTFVDIPLCESRGDSRLSAGSASVSGSSKDRDSGPSFPSKSSIRSGANSAKPRRSAAAAARAAARSRPIICAKADRACWARERKQGLTIPPVSPAAGSGGRVRQRMSSFINGITNGTGTCSSPIAIGSSPVQSPTRVSSPPSPIQIESSPPSSASSASPIQTRYVTPHSSSPSLPSGTSNPPSPLSSPVRPSRVQPSSPSSPTPAFHRKIHGGSSRMKGQSAGEGAELSAKAKGKLKAESVDESVGEGVELPKEANGKQKAVESVAEVRKRRCTDDGPLEDPSSPASTLSIEEISVHLNTPSSPVQASTRRKRVVERMTHVEIPIRRSTRTRISRVPLSSNSRAPRVPLSTSSLQQWGSSSTSPRSTLPNIGLGDDAPEYLRKVVEHCSRFCELEGGGVYQWVIELLVRFEVKQRYQAARNLTTVGRPPQVGARIVVGRRVPFEARIADVGEFVDAIEEWWCNCVPSWRYDEGTETLTRGRGQWEYLPVSGANGPSSVVAVLGWWLKSLVQLPRKGFREKQFYTEQFAHWVETTEDVEYSFEELLK
ncbi:hypothetical protein V5O48_006327 [Marasmius crinis-equi]|uniref:Uncharacterized protein n=1 Tax=Marasmius crinis-equi TaxID=585013 RepID=A0ABR3FJZ8_9AGAR